MKRTDRRDATANRTRPGHRSAPTTGVGLRGRTKLTPPQIAERYGCSTDKVLGWIKAGELRAINAASRRDQRPRYLVDLADLAAFEQGRAVVPAVPQRRARRRASGEVIPFF